VRNRYGGDCYKCGLWVKLGTGHFERHKGRWRTQHGLHRGEGRITCDEATAEAVDDEMRRRRSEVSQYGSVS
jgi:hypothetical protein